MSYILEALKKADQQRQRGAAPTLLTVQTAAMAYRRPRFPRNAAIALVLLCAGIAVGWLRPWQSNGSAPVTQAIATHPALPGARSAEPAPPPQLPQMASASEQAPVAQESTPSVRSGPRSTGTVTQGETLPLVHGEPRAALAPADASVPQLAAMPAPDKKQPGDLVDAGPGKRVMALNELPPSIQQEIPGISIAFHVYSSKPKDRRVMINGEMVEQGQQLASGLSLEEITPDGVILAYKGYRFRRGVR